MKHLKDFAQTRHDGAEKISKGAKEKGGHALLTWRHFDVKLPYYKSVVDDEFELEEAKKEFEKTLKSINLEMTQNEFQKEVGRLEVLGELILKSK
jgi:hypothetical protein